MDSLLQGLGMVSVYLNDILITGSDEAVHLQNLERVFDKLMAAGLKLNKAKCIFMAPSVEYLGHVIREKVKAIEEAHFPTSVMELKVCLGLLNYSKFLPNLASKLSPLYKLLHNTTKWTWGRTQKDDFCEAERLFQSDSLLVYLDENKLLSLVCEALSYRVGAVLFNHSNRALRGCKVSPWL